MLVSKYMRGEESTNMGLLYVLPFQYATNFGAGLLILKCVNSREAVIRSYFLAQVTVCTLYLALSTANTCTAQVLNERRYSVQ